MKLKQLKKKEIVGLFTGLLAMFYNYVKKNVPDDQIESVTGVTEFGLKINSTILDRQSKMGFQVVIDDDKSRNKTIILTALGTRKRN